MTTVLDIHNLETPPEIVEVIVQESRLDASAIHKTTASEISEIEEKTTLSENDYFLIEDSEDSNNKKSSTISALTTFSSGEVNTISNIGTSGIGIYKQKDGVNFELKKINPLSSKITVVDNTTDNEINLDIAENEINHNNITNVGTLTHSEIDNYINNEALIKSVYDPNNINADIFNLDNIVEGITNKILTTSERSKISNLPDDTQSALNAINSILSSDDTSLDELQEIVNYIKTNKSTLDALSFDDIAETLTYKYYTLTEKNKLSGIEENATGDQTGAEIKSLYESESDTNAFTDAEKTKLAGLTGGSGGYISEEDSTNLTDNGETTLHYHASDRDRANHTGTQTASTISDFDAEVSNNSDVSSNTTYRNIGHIPNSEKGSNNGVATLDSGGKVPSTQLPITIMNYLGTWNANTNDPNLLDGTGSAGDVYKISVSGSKDLGSGSIDFDIGDWIIYNGSIWEKNDNTDAVTSVNSQTGIVSLDSDDISEGSTNLYLSGNEFQKNVDTMDNITNGSTYVKTTNDYTNTEKTKLSNIEENATADLTSSEIKSLYESESNTNAYTDADKTKVDNTSGINTGDQDTSTIIHEKIGTPTYKTLKDWFDTVQSAGVISGGTITDNGDGTVAVSAGTGIIKSTNSDVGENLFFDFAASSSVSVDDNALSYIAIDYNLGTPQITANTTKTANGHTIFNLGKCYREGTVIDILNSGHRIQDLSKRIQQHHVETDDIQFVSGAVVSETGTRNIAITAGVLYAGLNRISIDSIDTSGSDTFEHYYYNGSAWVKSDQTQIDNTQYNDITSGLSTLSNNQYGVHWVYKGTNGGAYVIYGQDSYTLAEAQSADIPSSLPDHVDNFGALRSKIIIAKNATTFTEIENIKTTNFQAVSASDHNELTGLQGGTSDEYYHLTNTQYTDLTDGGETTLHTHASSGGMSDIVGDTTPQLGGNLDGLGNYLIDVQNIADNTVEKNVGYYFDGINDYQTINDNDNLDVGTNNFFIQISITPYDTTRTTDYLINKESGGIGYGLYLNEDDLCLRFDDGTVDASAIIAPACFVNNVNYNIIVSFDRFNNATAYINGKEYGTIDISSAYRTLSNSGDVKIGCDYSEDNFFLGVIKGIKIGNVACTQQEIWALFSSNTIPYNCFSANQTNLITNGDFSSTNNWAVGSRWEITGGTANYDAFGLSSLIQTLSVEVGKKYEIKFTIINSGGDNGAKIKFTGDLLGNTIFGVGYEYFEDGTHIITRTAKKSTSDFRIEANTDTFLVDTFSLDNLSLKKAGCVCDLGSSGVGHNTWTDTSSNNLHGTVSGALPINTPANHTEKYIDLTVTGDTSFTLPAGYMIESITTTETAGNTLTGGLDIGITSGGAEIVSAHAVTASTTAICELVTGGNYNTTGVDDTIYITDTSGSGWNSASVKITVLMKKMEM